MQSKENKASSVRTQTEIIDMHLHFGAPEDEESGCYWSEEFTKQPAYLALLLLTGSLCKKIDIHHIRKHLLGVINRSKYVDKSVLLALDQVYDETGNVQPEQTHLFVPNSYLSDLAKENRRVLLGASVHPYRNDWEDELEFCLQNKAVLCKWIPSSQLINPEHPKCLPFYKKLVDYKLPLLCHTGPEYAIPTSDETYVEYNNPKYLRTALDEGVVVIIAHCAMPFFGLLDVDYQDDFGEFLKLFEEADQNNWNLFADLSAICSPFRTRYIKIIKENLKNIPASKLLYASDYPIPLSELTYNKSTNFFSWLKFVLKVRLTKNPLDKNFLVIKGMEFDDSIFTNAAKLFANIQYPT
ncbi:MAG: amidohydrolase family protein [Candidatus Aminicenantes bacterium]|nr:amidohydrolase family protein [Candidatus Aminicenantes bacterium]